MNYHNTKSMIATYKNLEGRSKIQQNKHLSSPSQTVTYHMLLPDQHPPWCTSWHTPTESTFPSTSYSSPLSVHVSQIDNQQLHSFLDLHQLIEQLMRAGTTFPNSSSSLLGLRPLTSQRLLIQTKHHGCNFTKTSIAQKAQRKLFSAFHRASGEHAPSSSSAFFLLSVDTSPSTNNKSNALPLLMDVSSNALPA